MDDADCVTGPRECGASPLCFLPGFCDDGEDALLEAGRAGSQTACLQDCQVCVWCVRSDQSLVQYNYVVHENHS